MSEEQHQLSFDFIEPEAKERLFLNIQCKYVQEPARNIYDFNCHRQLKINRELAFHYSEILKLVVHLQE